MENVREKNTTLKKIGNIAFYVVLGIVVIYALFALFSDKEENQISFFGITSLAVQSDSMKPTFEKGDLIFIDTTFDVDALEEGDVVTYVDFIDGEEVYNTHRIINIEEVGGILRFTTQGDNNPTEDARRLIASDIVGVWEGTTWNNFGNFVNGFTNFIKSSLGFFLLIVLPAVAFLVYEIVRFVKVYSDYNHQKQTADRVKLQEEALAEAKRQLEQEKNQNKKEEDKE